MDRKGKVHLTNEEVKKKFKNNFDLVNYAIRLAENMIKTGRDARVKSDVQNRAMLILEEISEGKDHFDDIETTAVKGAFDFDHEGALKPALVFEERENRKYRTAEVLDADE